jgi:polysaccharide biosynthesis transport protein
MSTLLGKSDAPAPLQVAEPDEGRKVPITREELAVVHEPRGQIAEQFRTLRNSIHALNPEGAPRTLVVTSALRGEGKSVAAVNLALALAEMPGNQVLLLDANLHDPAVEDLLSLPRRQGLSELLAGRLPLDSATRATSAQGLAVVGAGSNPRNPSELLASDRMRTLLRTLKQRYSYVVLDTPEATTTSDASVLGSVADGILLVVRQGYTPRHYVEATHNQLEALGGNVLGTCLTFSNREDTARGKG